MKYQSTRDRSVRLPAADVILQGLSRDGGLFVPESIPALSQSLVAELTAMPYQQRAVNIMKMFLDDFTTDEIAHFAESAYSMSTFDDPEVAPLRRLDESDYVLELWHGPTCAFKDMALQMLPHLLTASLQKAGSDKDVCILVATSGDTGKAALEGFRDVARTKIMTFYPKDGVSDIQRLQMVTQEGGNVGVCAVQGNFDDAQAGVKKIFSDQALCAEVDRAGYLLSSANSINWGRLLPQIVYYISAYCDMIQSGEIRYGEKINFAVPTGNFGNILAGFYAKQMGLPIKKLICASNQNDVLTEFIETGVYNRNRAFYTTISPSMDILVSSNLERLLFSISGNDDALISDLMANLSSNGSYEVPDGMRRLIQDEFAAGCCSDVDTKKAIGAVFDRHQYVMDTHTAVAYDVLQRYRQKNVDGTKTVIVSTASPYKFCDSVLDALGYRSDADDFERIQKLYEVTGLKIPESLLSLREKAIRFRDSVDKNDMPDVVKRFLRR